jgi:hypothetical protein
LSGGDTPADGADPRTFPAIWNGTADDLEAGDYSKVPTGGTAGQVLVKDSGTDFDLSYELRGVAVPLPGGFYYGPFANTTSSNTGSLIFAPVFFHTPTLVDRLRCEVTVAGGAGSVVRMGMYAPGTDNLPDALIVDAGTVVSDSTGIKDLTISETVSGLVWLAGVSQPTGASPTVRASNNLNLSSTLPTGAAMNSGAVLFQSSVSGALPSTVTSLTQGATNVTVVQVRVA